MKRTVLLFATAVCLLASCSRPKDYDFVSPHFILQYCKIENVYVEFDAKKNLITLNPCIAGVPYYYAYIDRDGQPKQGPERDIFDSLAAKNGDLAYNRKVYITSYAFRQFSSTQGIWFRNYEASASDITSIDIVADKEWDEAHPAGSSLADLFYFDALNRYLYIKSGYSDEVQVRTRIHKLLSEIDPDDYRLTFFSDFNYIGNPNYRDVFDSLPASAAKVPALIPASAPADNDYPYLLTVTMHMDDGAIYEHQVELTQPVR